MQRTVRALGIGGLLASAALIFLSSSGWAQKNANAPPNNANMGESVKFTTVDGVDLHGTFYVASKKNAPAVMIVHAIGSSSRRKEYADLADALREKGFSVLTFDLRGHGQSKNVNPANFWSPEFANLKFTQGAARNKATIELQDIDKRYYNVFVNDIAAAKAFLDRRNDSSDCNSSSLTVIGAESGATLAAIWMNSEWHRYKMVPQKVGFVERLQPDTTSEGKNIICAVWLSISPELGTRKVNLTQLLYLPGKEKKTAMVFLYNEADGQDKSTSVALAKSIKGKNKNDYQYTDAAKVNAGPKLKGVELLNAQLPTTDAIVGYLPKVLEDRKNEWEEQDSRKSQFAWKKGLQFMPSQTATDRVLKYSLYQDYFQSR